MNAVTKQESRAVALADDDMIRVLQNSLYPGAKPESIRLVIAWCNATKRDPMKKPIHIVPMWVKDAASGRGETRDVLMPGIGTYRSDAASTGQYAGKTEPEFGPDVDGNVGTIRMTYPRWCKVTVQRLVGGQIRSFTAVEYWTENYATAGRNQDEPNAMWRRRPYGQLAKCAESQALRMAFPDETGGTNTIEEMDGKAFEGVTLDADPPRQAARPPAQIERQPPTVEPTGRTLRDDINRQADTAVAAAAATPPAKRTGRQWLDELNAKITACSTEDELVTLTGSPEMKKALAWFTNGALAELNRMLGDAMGRLAEATEAAGPPDEDVPLPEVPPVPDDDVFPGDRP